MKTFIRKIERFIDDITASNLLIHAIMIFAAIASYGNIKAFLSAGHTNELTAHALAGVLGVSLVVAASRLTKLNLSQLRHDRYLQTVVAIALATGIVSGLLQTLEYSNHYHWLPAAMLGFGIPLLLEVAPALTVALLKSIDANERTEELRRNMADRITDSIATALEGINPNDIRKEVETAARIFTKEFVNNVAGEMLFQLRQGNHHTLSALLAEAQPQGATDALKAQPKPAQPKQSEPKPQAQPTDRLDDLLQLLSEIEDPDDINKTALGRALGVSRTQVGNDIEKLIEAGRLTINGKVEVLR